MRGSCCEGGDLACHGCNPVLLAEGIPCEEQTTDREKAHSRDCFCDKSCILFQARVSNQVKSCNSVTFDDLKLTLIDLDLKSRNKDCCDDHEDFCTELYGAEGNFKL